jgi:hypothetical protein
MAVEPHRGRSLPLRLQEGVSRTRILERRLGEVQSGKTGKQGGRNPQGNAVVPLGPLAVPGMPPRGRIPSVAGLPATPGHPLKEALKQKIADLPSGLPDSSQDLIGKLTLALPAIEE